MDNSKIRDKRFYINYARWLHSEMVKERLDRRFERSLEPHEEEIAFICKKHKITDEEISDDQNKTNETSI